MIRWSALGWAGPSITPGSGHRTPPVPAPAPCQMAVTHTSPASSLLTTLHHPAPLCHQYTASHLPSFCHKNASNSMCVFLPVCTVKTVLPFPLRGRLYSFSWGKYYLFEMEKPSFPTSSILIWESSPFLHWRGPFSQLGEHRPLFNGMLDIFSRRNTVLLTIDLNRKEFHYQKSYQLL